MARRTIKTILNSNPGRSCRKEKAVITAAHLFFGSRPPGPSPWAGGASSRAAALRIPFRKGASAVMCLLLASLALLPLGLFSPDVFAVGESASLSSSGVNFEITPTSANPNGTVAIGTDNLTVSSTCSSGYKLYISTTSNDETASALKNADNAEYSIPAVSGTITSPTLLNSASSKNHWGFAMTSSETGIADTGFSESTNTTVTNTSLFSSIPTLDNMTTIRQKTSSADNETVNVYYGVNAGTDLTPGSYSSTVMYTMVMPSPCDYTLMFEDGVSDSDPVKSEVTKMPESTNVGRNTEVNLGDYISEFSREGYSITGWKNLTDNLTYGKDDTVNINTTNVDIIKLAPIWTINNYTVSINTVTGISSVSAKIGSGSGMEVNNLSEAVQYGTTVTMSYTESDGYHFTGWEIKNVDTDSEGNPLLDDGDIAQIPSTDTYTFTMPASNAELSPKAEGNKYTVHFNANGGTGTIDDIEMTYGSPSTLPENTFDYDDYEFYGWSKTQQDPSTDPERDYTDGQTGVFNLTTSNSAGTGSATLYAVWKIPLIYDDIMQNWTGCTSLVVSTAKNYEDPSTYADLLDTRNDVIYRVRRYNDGACWMAENLRLTPGDSDPGPNIISSGTLTTTADTSQGVGEITFVDSGFNSSGAGITGLQAYYGGNTTNGAYYTWPAALVACPAGWTLPTDIQYTALLDSEDIANSSAGSTKIRSAPYSFVYAGYYLNSSLLQEGNMGDYWSSVQYSDNDGYRLFLYSDNVYAAHDSGKYRGFTVRCLQANDEITMRTFTSSQCAELTASTAENYMDKSTYRVLKDGRNAVYYTVRKYADDMCWMAENLQLAPGSSPPTTSVTTGSRTLYTYGSAGSGTVSFVSSFSTSTSNFVSQARYDVSNNSPSTNTGYYSWIAAKLVCPAGWSLPSNGEWKNFFEKEDIANSAEGSIKLQNPPYSIQYTGAYTGGSLGNLTSGYFWSRTANSSYNSYYMRFNETKVGTDYYYVGPQQGIAVRCVHS